jgi:hypothetical protein
MKMSSYLVLDSETKKSKLDLKKSFLTLNWYEFIYTPKLVSWSVSWSNSAKKVDEKLTLGYIHVLTQKLCMRDLNQFLSISKLVQIQIMIKPPIKLTSCSNK